MSLGRRQFLGEIGVALGAAPLAGAGKQKPRRKILAVAFDAFVIFDSRTIAAAARDVLGTEGPVFAAAWLQKLFGNTWLLTSAGRYQPFDAVAATSLAATAESRVISLTPRSRAVLLDSLSRLEVWPDVGPGLVKLRAAGIRTCILSNLSEGLLASNLERSGLRSSFDAILSTDRVRRYKPAPMAYSMAPRVLDLPISNIGFAAFGGWDALGATWFGYRTAWVNRAGAAGEAFDVAPEIVSAGMDGVLRLAGV